MKEKGIPLKIRVLEPSKSSIVESSKTVILTPSLTASEIEQQLKKKLGQTGEESSYSHHRLHKISVSTPMPVDLTTVVWELRNAEPDAQFIFKKPDKGGDYYHSKKDKGDEGSSKPSLSKFLKEDFSKKAKSKKDKIRSKAISEKERITIKIRYQEQTHTYSFHASNHTWDYVLGHVCPLFGLKYTPGSYTFFERTKGVYINDIPTLTHHHDNTILSLVPVGKEVKRVMEMVTSSDSSTVRTGLICLSSFIDGSRSILLTVLQERAVDFLLNVIDHPGKYSPDTLSLALRLIHGCVESYLDPGLARKRGVPGLRVSPTSVMGLTELAAGTSSVFQFSFSLRVLASQVILTLVRVDNSYFTYIDRQLRRTSSQQATTPPSPSPLPTSSQDGEGEEEDLSLPEGVPDDHILVPLLRSFLKEKDILLCMVILDLIVLVISNAPYVPPSSPLREGDEGEGPEARLFYESKEGMLEVLFGCPAFVSLIHSLAVNPGRAEVEDSLMGLQECMVDAAFWEKDLTFVRDDPVHEGKLMDLWEACYPDIPLENRVSREWKRMGFQSDDPVRDFRAMGMLGLKHLLFIASQEGNTFRKLCDEMEKRSEHYYPIATGGMMISQMLVTHCTRHTTPPHQKLLPSLFDGPYALPQLYCLLSRTLFSLFDERDANYMSFGTIKSDLEAMFSTHLESCATVREIAQKIYAAIEEEGEKEDEGGGGGGEKVETTAVFQWGGGGKSSPSMEHLGGLAAKVVRSVAASSHIVAVTETAGVWGWGAFSCGQLGELKGGAGSGGGDCWEGG